MRCGSSSISKLGLTWRFPPETRFLGEVVTNASRIFLVGSTGLGKSQLAHAIGAGLASGNGFLDWQTDKPEGARVLVVDGEMSTRTIKKRMTAAMRREGSSLAAGKMILFAMDRAEEFAARFPELGAVSALNRPQGAAFLLRLIRLVNPDVVVFDNVMSLTEGDQKDEITWKQAEPLIKTVTGLGIAQIWLDHTGHDKSRQYGANAKAWIMDAVGIMTTATGNGNGQIAFRLSFDPTRNGKARHRDEDNAADFADRIIRLANDEWICEPADLLEHGSQVAKEIVATKRHKELLAVAERVVVTNGCDYTTSDGEVVRAAKVGDWRAAVLDAAPEDERSAERGKFDRDIADMESRRGAIFTEGERRAKVFWLPTPIPDREDDDD